MTAETDQRADLPAGVEIDPPAPGVAVMACRCGAVLDLADMHRPPRPGNTGAAPLIDPITCEECA